MKKLITMIIAIAMVVTAAVPTFAAESAAPTAKPAKVQELKVEKNGYKSLKLSWKPQRAIRFIGLKPERAAASL